MMSKTHLSVGIAVALAAAPATPEGLHYALLGGAVGSMICDIDRNYEQPSGDARQGWSIAVAVFITVFLQGSASNWPRFRDLFLAGGPEIWVIFVLLAVLLLFAVTGTHRGFSHSLLMFFCSSFLLFFLSRQFTFFYMIAFITHLFLDVLNKRPVKILYPMKKGFCLGWCYCDGLMNKILLLAGGAGIIGILICKFGIRIVNSV